MKAIFGFLSIFFLTFSIAETPLETTTTYKLIIFEGSDWCRNCRRFEKEVLSKTNFIHFLEENSIQVEKIDFPQRKKLDKSVEKYNNSIAEKYAFEGVFPTIILAHVGSDKFLKLTDYVNQTVEEIQRQLVSNMESLK